MSVSSLKTVVFVFLSEVNCVNLCRIHDKVSTLESIPINSDNVSQSLNVINVFCPICNQSIQVQNDRDVDLAVNKHIDICLNNKAISNLSPNPHDSPLMVNNQTFYESDYKLNNVSNKTSNLSKKTKLSKSNSILNYMVNKN